jgi:hypothetical protein
MAEMLFKRVRKSLEERDGRKNSRKMCLGEKEH